MVESPLLKNQSGYIGGKWISGPGKSLDVVNPATGELLARLATFGEPETVNAIEAAESALRSYASLDERARWLTDMYDRMMGRRQELARIITLEHGKPLKEGVTEVEYAAGFFKFFAQQLPHLAPRELPEKIRDFRWTVHYRPAGVAGLITPWNFPVGMIAKKLAPALGAGCACVIKPAGKTPLSMIALFHLLDDLRLPAGQVNMVFGPAGAIGKVLCTHPEVRILSFTGSTETGRTLADQAAPHIKRLAMELGGNAPFIVFEDADIDAAVAGLMANKFRAGGQTCVCANRVYVHHSVLEPFTAKAAERVKALRVGNGLDPQTDLGPLIDRVAFDKVAAHVNDAVQRGAQRVVGNDPPRPKEDWGSFFPPTLLTGVTPEMLVCREETFGPVVAISEFTDESAVVDAANSTPFGLASYVYTRDAARAQRVIERLKFGHVGLNTGTGPTPEAPFGGMKQSGYGREGGLEGLLEFCDPQVVASA